MQVLAMQVFIHNILGNQHWNSLAGVQYVVVLENMHVANTFGPLQCIRNYRHHFIVANSFLYHLLLSKPQQPQPTACMLYSAMPPVC